MVLLLFLVMLLFPISGYPERYTNSISQTGINIILSAASANSQVANFQHSLSGRICQSYNPVGNYMFQVFMVVEKGLTFSLVLLLLLLLLWFYRRYEIRRINRLNLFKNQKEVIQEKNGSTNLPVLRNEEQIDQCLTGMYDKRLCFFKLNGNVIHIEDNSNAGSQPASADLLRNKIDADKFCTHLCLLKEYQKLSLNELVSKENTQNQNSLSQFSFTEIQVKPDHHTNELLPFNDSFYLTTHKPVMHINASAVSPFDQEFIIKAAKTVENNFSDFRFSVELLASELNMSVSQLNRKLNALTGHTAGRLISSYRLQQASDHLIKTTDSISEICYNSGFNGLAYFSRAFKREFGCTPSVYRQLMTKKSISVHK